MSVSLPTMTAAEGFRVEGEALDDGAGKSVASAGDVNGDGLDDFVIGAPGNDAGGTDAGAAYVIFGNAAGLPNLDLSTLTPSQGFKIVGEAAGDYLGESFSSAGDVNGDGFDDLILGAYRNDAAGTNAGAAYVIFGKATGFGTIDLAALAPADGFKITGDGAQDNAGRFVAAGDVNGDGLNDVIIGAPGSNGSTSGTGAAYVVYGAESGLSDIDLASLDATNGFAIHDTIDAHATVQSVGDVNGDGFDDVTINAPNYGATYYDDYYQYYRAGGTFTIYGKAAAHGDVDLGALTPDQGVVVTPMTDSGVPIGDFDGDGIDDFASVDAPISGDDSVLINYSSGGSSLVEHANSVAGVGDFNGDGFTDVIVGSQAAGHAYIVFGRANTFSAFDLLQSVAEEDALLITGHTPDGFVQRGAAAGDINGDGFDDIVFGAPGFREFTGTFPNYSYGDETGGAYVVYGQAPTGPVGRIGGAGDQAINGGAYDDTLDGRGGDDSLYGGIGNDILIGGSGADLLDGGTGADTLIGGTGSDTYVVNTASDIIVERAGEGNDLVRSSTTYTLADNVENLTLTGTYAIGATGNARANALMGNDAANMLVGNAGNDTIVGAGGKDTLEGDDGNDTLDGGAGADTMDGGLGNDTYKVDNVGDAVKETSATGGIDRVISTVTFTLATNVEQLTLSGAGNLNGTGNTLDNILTGNDANNILNGKTGADRMVGGLGNDFYYVDNVGDRAVETSAGGGLDKVNSTVTFTLGANVEQLVLGGSAAIDGNGNTLGNSITGNGAANVLKGLAGVDFLKGGAGDDTLQGGADKDTLTGGTGNDKFVFLAGDTGATHSLADHITDFATGDLIDLHSIDANLTLANNQAFHFIGTAAFSVGDAGALRYSTGGGVTWIEGDSNGDGTADLSIYLAGDHTMAATDFVL